LSQSNWYTRLHHPPARLERLEPRRLLSAAFFVSTRGDDANPGTDPGLPWRHIQKAFDSATPGSTVTVMAGRYNEKLVVNVSGNETDGYITFQAQGRAIISGKKVAGNDVISINNRRFIRIIGFEIRDNLKVNNGSGIRLTESNSFIQILNNRITKITGTSAMGITVYGTDPAAGISNLLIDGNEIFRCQPAPSEAIVLNGNVQSFAVTNNYVHHVNNIGMDFIGGEGRSADPATDFPRNGQVAGNRVTRATFKGAGRDAAGIFIDGAENLVVERNTVWRNDVGIEVNAIHPARVARGILVRDNFVANNNRAGISIGGADDAAGSVQDSSVINNTMYRNDLRRTESGEIRVQNATNNVIRNNVVETTARTLIFNSEKAAGLNTSDNNIYHFKGNPAAARFAWMGLPYAGLDAFRAASLQDAASAFADPLLLRPSRLDLHLSPESPAINFGDPLFAPGVNELDIDAQARVAGGRVDAGADEAA
jgi:hypothetical protein